MHAKRLSGEKGRGTERERGRGVSISTVWSIQQFTLYSCTSLWPRMFKASESELSSPEHHQQVRASSYPEKPVGAQTGPARLDIKTRTSRNNKHKPPNIGVSQLPQVGTTAFSSLVKSGKCAAQASPGALSSVRHRPGLEHLPSTCPAAALPFHRIRPRPAGARQPLSSHAVTRAHDRGGYVIRAQITE